MSDLRFVANTNITMERKVISILIFKIYNSGLVMIFPTAPNEKRLQSLKFIVYRKFILSLFTFQKTIQQSSRKCPTALESWTCFRSIAIHYSSFKSSQFHKIIALQNNFKKIWNENKSYSLKNQLLLVVVSTQPAKVGFSGCTET